MRPPPLPALLLFLVAITGITSAVASEGTETSTLEVEHVVERLEQELRGRKETLRDRSDRQLYLSETTTLAMELALLRGEQGAFHRERAVLVDRFLSPVGLLRWRLGRSKDGWCSNASVDDLRAVRALLGAHERWGDPEDARLGLMIGRALLEHNVRDGVLVDAASWTCGFSVSATNTLAAPVFAWPQS